MSEAPNADQWAAILAKYQDPFAAAEEIGGRYEPPVGDYHCVVKSVRTGITKKNDPYWAIDATLLDGTDEAGQSLEGRDFQIGFFTLNNDVSQGIFKGLARVLSGSSVGDIGVADEIIKASPGKTLKVNVALSKDGQYKNVYVRSLVDDVGDPPAA